jgi:hypothetical protein
MTSSEVRSQLVEALRLDLVGPDNAHAFAHELLPDAPSRWYMCGFLVPSSAPTEQKSDETSGDEIDSGDDTKGADDAAPPDRATARKSMLPSSMGLSVLVAPGVDALEAKVAWGDYLYEGAVEPGDVLPTTETAAELHDKPVSAQSEEKAQGQDDGKAGASPKGYRREPREETVSIALPKPGGKPKEFPVPNSGGLTISVTVRAVPAAGQAGSRLPAGTRSVSVFVVNNRPPNEERHYRAFAFQTSLIFKELCNLEVEADGVVFDPRSVGCEDIRAQDEYAGIRVKLRATLGKAVVPLQVDVGFGDALPVAPEEITFPVMLGMAAPKLRAYSRETVVAEKLEAIVKLGMLNSRFKDYFDLHYLAQKFPFDGVLLAKSIAGTFVRRGTAFPAGLPAGLTPMFGTDPAKIRGWQAFWRKSGTKAAVPPLEAVIQLLVEFLEPPLTSAAKGKPLTETWKSNRWLAH